MEFNVYQPISEYELDYLVFRVDMHRINVIPVQAGIHNF